jgi:hypothetical protein
MVAWSDSVLDYILTLIAIKRITVKRKVSIQNKKEVKR